MIDSYVLGIDTSNYTTSVALYNLSNDEIFSVRRLLPVKDGQLGLRQSDAVFHHTQQLPQLINELFDKLNEKPNIIAVGASYAPRSQEGSYMPCFTVGTGTASVLSTVLDIPLYHFSHQAGHIAAAIYSSKKYELFDNRFIAFHVSGGTTEAVLVEPDSNCVFKTTLIARSLDLHAGQAIDRIGVRMGLSFPCGKELESLALACDEKVSVRPCIKGCDCCLSGIENICSTMLDKGESKEKTALTCLKFISLSLDKMCLAITAKYGNIPVLFAGGVMSNSIIKKDLSKKINCVFALPEYSTDNACGTSFLTARRYLKEFGK